MNLAFSELSSWTLDTEAIYVYLIGRNMNIHDFIPADSIDGVTSFTTGCNCLQEGYLGENIHSLQ